MRRSRRNRRPNILGGILLLLVPVAAVLAVFNFVPDHYLERNWPFGIEQEEVDAYNDRLSFFGSENLSSTKPDWTLDALPVEGRPLISDTSASPRWGYADLKTGSEILQVKVRRLRTVEGGLLIKSPKGSYINGMRQVVLIPADVSSIRDKYLQILADELRVPAPDVSFVRLSLNGGRPDIYLCEERIDDHFAERYIGSDAQVFEKCADPRWPACVAPDMDDDKARQVIEQQLQNLYNGSSGIKEVLDLPATQGLVALAITSNDPARLANHRTYAFRWMDGKIVPIHRSSRDGIASSGLSASSVLGIAASQVDLDNDETYKKVVDQIWRVKERFADARNTWIPLLAESSGISESMASARAESIEDEVVDQFLSAVDRLSTWNFSAARSHSLASLSDRTEGSADTPLPTIGALAVKYNGWLEKDTLVLPRGRYIIDEDLIIPKGKGLKLLSGVRMFIAPEVSILCQAPFNVRASSLRPVFIRPLVSDSAWGSIAVNMEEGQKCFINGLFVSGGSEVVIGGHKHTGMLSFHNGDVHITNSHMRDSYGEDMVNVKNGKVYLGKNSFEDSFADLVDLDDARGTVIDCKFSAPATDINGDGLDLSNSKLFIESCTFANCSDKGLSVGESSEVLIMRSTFFQDSIGIAVKDLSKAYAFDCRFRSNTIAMNAYRKKAWLGGAELEHTASIFYTDGQRIEHDTLSKITETDELNREVLFEFEPYGAQLKRRRR